MSRDPTTVSDEESATWGRDWETAGQGAMPADRKEDGRTDGGSGRRWAENVYRRAKKGREILGSNSDPAIRRNCLVIIQGLQRKKDQKAPGCATEKASQTDRQKTARGPRTGGADGTERQKTGLRCGCYIYFLVYVEGLCDALWNGDNVVKLATWVWAGKPSQSSRKKKNR